MDDNKNIEKENVDLPVNEDNGHLVTADELVMDEATIIREQERLAQEKKRKASAKRKKIIFSILGVILVLVIAFFAWGRKLFFKETDNTVKIAAEANQTITFVKVDSVNGNEISYTCLEEQEETEAASSENVSKIPKDNFGNSKDSKSDSSADGRSSKGSGGGFGNFDPSNMPSGFEPSSMPDGGDSSSGMPSMPSDFDPSNMPSGFGGGSSGSSGGKSFGSGSRASATLTYNGKNYKLTDKTKVEYIPVGTVVTTKLGTETTFSRISAGDCLALVTENINGVETIISIYIVG